MTLASYPDWLILTVSTLAVFAGALATVHLGRILQGGRPWYSLHWLGVNVCLGAIINIQLCVVMLFFDLALLQGRGSDGYGNIIFKLVMGELLALWLLHWNFRFSMPHWQRRHHRRLSQVRYAH